MAILDLGVKTERLTRPQAQALLDADLACAQIGLKFSVVCAVCGTGAGADLTRARQGKVLHYEVICQCNTRRVFESWAEPS